MQMAFMVIKKQWTRYIYDLGYSSMAIVSRDVLALVISRLHGWHLLSDSHGEHTMSPQLSNNHVNSMVSYPGTGKGLSLEAPAE